MAQRRMFSPGIVCSDAFLDMPFSSQALYFHLGMDADDDGFVNPKRIMRMIGFTEDDIKVLIGKRFVLPFESGVVVIKHWLIHNLIRADLYKETLYKKEKLLIGLNESGAYTELRRGVYELKQIEPPEWLKRRRKDVRPANGPQTVHRLGKVRLGKVSNTHSATKNVAVRVPSKKQGNEPMNLQQFIASCQGNKDRRIEIICWLADLKEPAFTSKAQWQVFLRRNLRIAGDLAPYSDDQLNDALYKLKQARAREPGFLTKWGLETIAKFLIT